MSKAYKAIVNDHITVELDIHDAIVSQEVIDGNLVGLHNENKVEARLLESNFDARTYRIRLSGNSYTIQLQNKLDQQIQDLGLSIGNQATKNKVEAPMPGLILDILISEGEFVEEGDGLLILEAMKMENKLVASRHGVIKTIHITPNQTVDKGLVLIEFEEDEN